MGGQAELVYNTLVVFAVLGFGLHSINFPSRFLASYLLNTASLYVHYIYSECSIITRTHL